MSCAMHCPNSADPEDHDVSISETSRSDTLPGGRRIKVVMDISDIMGEPTSGEYSSCTLPFNLLHSQREKLFEHADQLNENDSSDVDKVFATQNKNSIPLPPIQAFVEGVHEGFIDLPDASQSDLNMEITHVCSSMQEKLPNTETELHVCQSVNTENVPVCLSLLQDKVNNSVAEICPDIGIELKPLCLSLTQERSINKSAEIYSDIKTDIVHMCHSPVHNPSDLTKQVKPKNKNASFSSFSEELTYAHAYENVELKTDDVEPLCICPSHDDSFNATTEELVYLNVIEPVCISPKSRELTVIEDDGLKMSLVHCECPPSNRKAIPANQVFQIDGELFYIPSAKLLNIGSLQIYGYEKGGSWYVPMALLNRILEADVQELFTQVAISSCFSLIFQRMGKNEIDFLKQKCSFDDTVESGYLISTSDLQYICSAIADELYDNVIQTLAYGNLCENKLQENSMCSSCGLTIKNSGASGSFSLSGGSNDCLQSNAKKTSEIKDVGDSTVNEKENVDYNAKAENEYESEFDMGRKAFRTRLKMLQNTIETGYKQRIKQSKSNLNYVINKAKSHKKQRDSIAEIVLAVGDYIVKDITVFKNRMKTNKVVLTNSKQCKMEEIDFEGKSLKEKERSDRKDPVFDPELETKMAANHLEKIAEAFDSYDWRAAEFQEPIYLNMDDDQGCFYKYDMLTDEHLVEIVNSAAMEADRTYQNGKSVHIDVDKDQLEGGSVSTDNKDDLSLNMNNSGDGWNDELCKETKIDMPHEKGDSLNAVPYNNLYSGHVKEVNDHVGPIVDKPQMNSDCRHEIKMKNGIIQSSSNIKKRVMRNGGLKENIQKKSKMTTKQHLNGCKLLNTELTKENSKCENSVISERSIDVSEAENGRTNMPGQIHVTKKEDMEPQVKAEEYPRQVVSSQHGLTQKKEMEENIRKFVKFSCNLTLEGNIKSKVEGFVPGAEQVFPALFSPDPNHLMARYLRKRFCFAAEEFMDHLLKQNHVRESLPQGNHVLSETLQEKRNCSDVQPKSLYSQHIPNHCIKETSSIVSQESPLKENSICSSIQKTSPDRQAVPNVTYSSSIMCSTNTDCPTLKLVLRPQVPKMLIKKNPKTCDFNAIPLDRVDAEVLPFNTYARCQSSQSNEVKVFDSKMSQKNEISSSIKEKLVELRNYSKSRCDQSVSESANTNFEDCTEEQTSISDNPKHDFEALVTVADGKSAVSGVENDDNGIDSCIVVERRERRKHIILKFKRSTSLQLDVNNNGVTTNSTVAVQPNPVQVESAGSEEGITQSDRTGHVVKTSLSVNGGDNQKQLLSKTLVRRKRTKSENSCGIKMKFRRLSEEKVFSSEFVTQLSNAELAISDKQTKGKELKDKVEEIQSVVTCPKQMWDLDVFKCFVRLQRVCIPGCNFSFFV
ncbi:uncharacterized protein LOC127841629 isoform X2 [Dreissena polymorpha]|nr:uncharacterized protein LOC127841629 isoform X2 [Dreissena polymorpha]